jgi:CubicO group peptidase (beta-lactamase class C family)
MRWRTPEGAGADRADIGFHQANWDEPQFLARGQQAPEERMYTAILEPSGPPASLPAGRALELDSRTVEDPLLGRPIALAILLERRLFNDGLLVVHDGAVRYEAYRNGFTAGDRHLLHSVSKTLTSMMIGIAVAEGRIDVDAEVRSYLPALVAPAWDGVTVQHVLDMATGIRTDEHYEQRDSMYWRYADIVGYYGGAPDDAGVLSFVVDHLVERQCPPGELFNYASYNSNLLPLCLEAVYGVPAVELYERHLFRRVGAEGEGALNCDSRGIPIVEGQLNLTLRDLTRWALLYLDGGRNLAGERVVPEAWITDTVSAAPHRRAAFERSESAEMFPQAEYHNQLWNLDVANGQSAMLGIHGQFVFLDRPRRLMIAGVSSYPTQLHPLLARSMQAVWATVQQAVDDD